LLSSEKFCECGDITVEYDGTGSACTETNTRVFGLIQFTKADNSAGVACGAENGGVYSYDQIKFNFLPLADATNDAFKVKFVLLAENTDLDAVNTRRRLRSIEHTQDIILKAPSPLDASASSFSVVVPSHNTAEDAQPAAPQVPVEPQSAEEDDEMETGVLVAIIAGSVVGFIILLCLINCGAKCVRKDSPFSAGGALNMFLPAVYEQVASSEGAAVGIRQQRFSNLRY
jgi:hypothetical protein